MSDSIIATSITSGISIIGFIITIILNKRNIKNEINKNKTNLQLEKSSELPSKLLKLWGQIINEAKDEDLSSQFEQIINTIVTPD